MDAWKDRQTGLPLPLPREDGKRDLPLVSPSSTGPQFSYLCRGLGIFSGVRNLEL